MFYTCSKAKVSGNERSKLVAEAGLYYQKYKAYIDNNTMPPAWMPSAAAITPASQPTCTEV